MRRLSRAIWAVVLISGVAWADEAGHAAASKPGLFSGSLADSFWTVVAFLVLMIVLGLWAWKPMLNALKARQGHIENEIKSAEESRRQAEHLLADSKQQGAVVVQQAAEQAQRHLQEAAEKSRQEASAIRHRTQEEIDSAKAAALEELWQQAGDIVLHVGSRVLSRTLTDQDNQRLVDEAVAKVREGGAAT